MTGETCSFDHGEYQIVVSHTPPCFQAAIHRKNPNLPNIDWKISPIRADNVTGAVDLAKQRINETFGILHTPETRGK